MNISCYERSFDDCSKVKFFFFFEISKKKKWYNIHTLTLINTYNLITKYHEIQKRLRVANKRIQSECQNTVNFTVLI